MNKEERNILREYAKQLKIKFNDISLLERALTHRSFSNEENSSYNNEKLEFLGDAVLALIITTYLFANCPELNEGDFARIRSYIVSEEILSAIGRKLSINHHIKIGKGEELTGGRDKKGIIADAFEALIGAIYVDQKMQKAEDFVIRLFQTELNQVINNEKGFDYKSLLQELIQKKHKDCPRYKLEHEEGPEHDKTFTMGVYINDTLYGTGTGKSKKEAEKIAARIAYSKLTS